MHYVYTYIHIHMIYVYTTSPPPEARELRHDKGAPGTAPFGAAEGEAHHFHHPPAPGLGVTGV